MAGKTFRSTYNDCVLPVCRDTFGEPIDYRPRKGGSFLVKGIYDAKFTQYDADTEEVIASNIPAVGLRLKDIPFKPEQGDEVRIEGEGRFKVHDSLEDGLGGVTLILHRA